ncbi:MAG: type IV pilus modification PilV family protein [Dethiobacteria bacterium]|jgi:prepilin-type N-terminal cleavage/methylation domain-containing protein
MYSCLWGREEGFSLIEVMAAVALLGILIIPIFSLFTGSVANVLHSSQETKAVTLAQEGMEILKGMGYAALKDYLQGKEEVSRQETIGDYSREVKLKCMPLAHLFPDAEGEVIFLQVLVSWGEADRQRSVSLVSYLGERNGGRESDPATEA